jgi:hypothetical protein
MPRHGPTPSTKANSREAAIASRRAIRAASLAVVVCVGRPARMSPPQLVTFLKASDEMKAWKAVSSFQRDTIRYSAASGRCSVDPRVS